MLQRTIKQKQHIEGFLERLRTMVEDMEKAHEIRPKLSFQLAQEKDNAHKIMIIQSVPYIADALGKMNLAFLCADRHTAFIASDAPCVLFNPELQWQRLYGPGFGQKHVEVSMPLSPKISVLFSWVNNVRGYLGIDQDQVHELNRMVFGYSHEYFIANSATLKRRWFRRYPLDPVLIWRIIRNTSKRKFAQWRHRRYVRGR